MIEQRLYRLAREPLAIPERARTSPPRRCAELLPQRGAWQLVHEVLAFDRDGRTIEVSAAAPPPLDGHFPDAPIYPGVLLIELVNQACICLLGLLGESTRVRLSRVHGAQFLAPVRPGEALVIRGAIDELDSLRGTASGQVLVGGTPRATAIVEVVFDA